MKKHCPYLRSILEGIPHDQGVRLHIYSGTNNEIIRTSFGNNHYGVTARMLKTYILRAFQC